MGNKTLANVTLAKYDFDVEEFDSITADAKDFITRLLRKVSSKRMTAGTALQHDWLKERTRRRKTCRIKIENLRKFLNRRKMQRIGKALVAISAFKEAARTSIGSISRQSMSSGYQTMDFEEIQGNGDEEKEEEGEGEEEDGGCFEENEDSINVCQSQVTDNSNSSDGGEDKQDEQQDDAESSDVEREDSLFREGGKLNLCERLSLTSGRNGRNGDDDPQGTQSVTSTRKYQRTATRPPPGTVKSLLAKFQ